MPHHRPLSLHVTGLSAGYRGGTVLHGLDLDLPAGTVHAVLGANGAGKTTLIHTVMGVGPVRRGSGRILLSEGARSHDISGWPAYRRARAGLALAPQGHRVFPTLTVEEHFKLIPHGTDPTRACSVEWLVTVFPQLARRLGSQGRHLSGGERQMLAIAVALLAQPRLLLLDEPTEGLASPMVQRVRQEIFAKLGADGVTVLLATPDLELARTVANHVTVLSAGRITARFDRANLPADPAPLLAALTPTPAGQPDTPTPATTRAGTRPPGDPDAPAEPDSTPAYRDQGACR